MQKLQKVENSDREIQYFNPESELVFGYSKEIESYITKSDFEALKRIEKKMEKATSLKGLSELRVKKISRDS